ncbi:DUF1330 domain-containing protein [Photobacterium rosenbergii]|uniref:DUF1330 domain-containing protein n=1 Tax=Photobacterium rosenbergii TaxID=294936 RepID=A0ABU3ZKX5_9GAMM|nr:DUF1330 domain-containing protein [Photobacterium rosenbergii]MDV5170710.1 DUF1330 domain-containing protein [Photobacterium rosenbergii]
MSTYIVFTRESTQDQEALVTYMDLVASTLEGHSVKVLSSYGALETLEGEEPEGAVIVEFPTKAAARAWYYSPAYQQVVQYRFKGAKYRAIMIDGN